MVDPVLLTSDILSNFAVLLTPGLLWLLLYAWAWQDPTTSWTAGFGRRVFWLLLPAGLIAMFGNVPFFTWDGSVLAMNLGGAAIPLALTTFLPARQIGKAGLRAIGRAFAVVAIEAALLFGLVLLPTAPGGSGLGVFLFYPRIGPTFLGPSLPPASIAPVLLGFAVIFAAYAFLAPAGPRPARSLADPALGFALLSTVVLLLTYSTTEAVPGVGILSAFPQYLFGPFLAGVLAVALARPLLGLRPIQGIAFGYGTATLGVLVGADILHQPPLYGGAPGFLSIGGAGLLDLVYLSGLLAVGLAVPLYYGGQRYAREPPLAPPTPPAPTAASRYFEAARRRSAGDPAGSLARSVDAADLSVARLHLLRGEPVPVPPADPWSGLEVHPWTSIDHENLRALARTPTPTDADAERGLRAAHQLLLASSDVARRHFGTVGDRALAFLLDLLLVTAPAIVIWALLAKLLPGTALEVATGIPYSTALYAYTAAGFLYFLLIELRYGTTFGKHWYGLEVRTRELGRPGIFALLARNLPRLIPFTLLAQLVGVGVVLLVRGTAEAPASILLVGFGGVDLILLGVVSVLFAGAITCGTMTLRGDRARIGDLWAGTWVLRRSSARSAPRA